jgi:hypothetical protein
MRDANTAVAYPQIVTTETGALEVRGAQVLMQTREALPLPDMLLWGSALFQGEGPLPPVADALIADLRTGHEGPVPTLLRSALKAAWSAADVDEAVVIVQHGKVGRHDLRLIRVYGNRTPRRSPMPDDTEQVVYLESGEPVEIDGAVVYMRRQMGTLSPVIHMATTKAGEAEERPWGWLTVLGLARVLRAVPVPGWGLPVVGDQGAVEIVLTDETQTVAGRATMMLSLEMNGEQAAHLLLLADWQQHDDVWLHPDKPRLIAMIEPNDNETACKIGFHVRQLAGVS